MTSIKVERIWEGFVMGSFAGAAIACFMAEHRPWISLLIMAFGFAVNEILIRLRRSQVKDTSNG